MIKIKWMRLDKNREKSVCLLRCPRKIFLFDRLCFPSTSIGKAALADRYDGGRNTPRGSVACSTQTLRTDVTFSCGCLVPCWVIQHSHPSLWICSEFACSDFLPLCEVAIKRI